MVLRFDTTSALMGKGRQTLLNGVSEAAAGNRVISGLAVSQRGAGANMSVDVASGHWVAGGSVGSKTSTTNIVISAADATNERFDLITADNAGALAVVTGTAAAVPLVPALPANKIPLAVVDVVANAVSIGNSAITDIREVLTYGRFLLASGSFSASSNLDLTSINQAFNHLEVIIDATLSTNADFSLTVNNDSPTNLHSARRLDNGSGSFQSQTTNINIAPTQTGYLALDIRVFLPFYSLARAKGFSWDTNYLAQTSNANLITTGDGSWDNATAISRLTFTPSAGNLSSGNYFLYGVL